FDVELYPDGTTAGPSTQQARRFRRACPGGSERDARSGARQTEAAGRHDVALHFARAAGDGARDGLQVALRCAAPHRGLAAEEKTVRARHLHGGASDALAEFGVEQL